jgi:type II secretory pathway predicted ATPase ExeA
MYLSHFNLNEKPFKISTDPKFLWLGEKHKEALATLLYGILYNDGYVVVTGDVGTGKTTLASALMNALNDRVIAVKVPFPDFDSLDFFKLISTAYGLSPHFESKGSFFASFSSFLQSSFASGKKVVLIIDEAQRLTADHLKELLHLSNLEEKGTRLLNIVFVGQNEFNDILLEDANRALKQRMTINYNLGALTPEETKQYIFHRLEVAQGQSEIFSPEAIAEIFRFSQGVPRLINIVCDLALLLTYFEKGKIVRPETIKDCVMRLRLPSEKIAPGEDGTDLPSGMERMVAEAIGETDPHELEARAGAEKGLKRGWGKAVYILLGALLIVPIGLLFFRERQTFTRPSTISGDSQQKTDLQSNAAPKGGESPKEKMNPDPSPQDVKEPAPSLAPAKGEEASARQQDPGVSEKIEPVHKANVQSGKIQKPATAGSKAAVRPVSKPLLNSAKENHRLKEEENRLEAERRALSENKEVRTGRPPDSATAQPTREPSKEGAEEIDPNKVIEWLIERRSTKE